MDPDEKKLIEHTRRYLSLQHLITLKQLTGENPPKDLIIQAREAGRLAGISEDELSSF